MPFWLAAYIRLNNMQIPGLVRARGSLGRRVVILGVLAYLVISVGDLLNIKSKVPQNDRKLFNPRHIIEI